MVLAAVLDETWYFVLALVGAILAGVVIVQTRATSLLAWGLLATSLAVAFAFWPGT
jgi:hypothetical protein